MTKQPSRSLIWIFAICLCLLVVPSSGIEPQEKSGAESVVARAARARTPDDALLILNTAIPSFGGFYRDREGTFSVYLMDMADRQKAEPVIRAYLEKLRPKGDSTWPEKPKLEFVTGQFTWFDLDDYKAGLRDVLTLPNVVSLDADEAGNCITIGTSQDDARAAVEKFAKDAGVPEAAVRIRHQEPYRMLVSLEDQFRPVKGGIRIKNDMGPWAWLGFSGVCTLNAVATLRGVRGFITNSHCTKIIGGVDGTNFFQTGRAAFGLDWVGVETGDPLWVSTLPGCPMGQMCRFSDSAFVTLDSTVASSRGKIAQPRAMCMGATPCNTDLNNATDELTIVGTGGLPVVGQVLHKIGRTTGWTSGVVSSVCVTVTASRVFPGLPTITITGLCQHVVDSISEEGDSGAPVFSLLPNNRVVLFGIVSSGAIATATTPASLSFSPITSIETELGTSLIVTQTAPPPPPPPPPRKICRQIRIECDGEVGPIHGPRPQHCARVQIGCGQ